MLGIYCSTTYVAILLFSGYYLYYQADVRFCYSTNYMAIWLFGRHNTYYSTDCHDIYYQALLFNMHKVFVTQQHGYLLSGRHQVFGIHSITRMFITYIAQHIARILIIYQSINKLQRMISIWWDWTVQIEAKARVENHSFVAAWMVASQS